MDKKIKWIFISIAIVILIIISILIYFIIKSPNPEISIAEDPGKADPPQDESSVQISMDVAECESFDEYFVVKDIIDNYNEYCISLNYKASDIEVNDSEISQEELEKAAEMEKETASNIIYNRLSKQYINEFNISKEDMAKFILEKGTESIINKMYVKQNSDNLSTYFVELTNINTISNKVSQEKIAVNLDFVNNTFEIYPEEYCEKHHYNNVKTGDKIDELTMSSIDVNDDNAFEYRIVEENEVALEYYNNYHMYALYNVEGAYDMLNQEYRNRRFDSLDGYKQYINKYKEDIEDSIIIKYQVIGNEGEKKYICIDNLNNYYIFNQKTISNYDLYIDTYTIDSKEFLDKYNNGDERTRAGMNVEKIFEALNNKDYRYIYNHLADSFKNNYYQNQSSFEGYIIQNIYDHNDKEYLDYKQKGNVHIFNLKVLNKEDDSEFKNMTIMVQLNEGTDYIISFSIE